MDTAKLFMNGRSQAVRLPKKYRLEGDEVIIRKVGSVIVLIPKDKNPWDIMREGARGFTDDFMEDRNQPMESEKRESFD